MEKENRGRGGGKEKRKDEVRRKEGAKIGG